MSTTPDRGIAAAGGVAAPDRARRRLLLGLFVVSGFTGLIYESIWSHYLKLFLGHAAYAQSLVLAIFMGGMAAGSWAVAHYSLRIRRLLRAYALVEGLIGLLGLLFHRAFIAASDFSFATAIPRLASAGWIQLYKWTLASVLILPQSVLLGMTFPLISGSLIRRWPQRPGETLATLYFANSLGAAIGVLISGFVLIDAVGLPGTIRVAGILNLALALAVLMLDSRTRRAGRRARRGCRAGGHIPLGTLAHARRRSDGGGLVHVRARVDSHAELGARQLHAFLRAHVERIYLGPRLRRTLCAAAN